MQMMNEQELRALLEQLVRLPKECEWVEFKLNFHSAEEIGERLSALANGACLFNQQNGYMVFGVRDTLQTIDGTSFRPSSHKQKGQELETWLLQRLDPRIDFRIYEFIYEDLLDKKQIVIFEIPAALHQPVKFNHVGYIRIGS
jgi:predicted HTH transcriptional regulator